MTQAKPARFIRRLPRAGGECIRAPGICEEAFRLFAPMVLPDKTAASLGRMTPVRQVEAVQVMSSVGNFSGDFGRALLAATSACKRADDARGRQSRPESVASLMRLEAGLLQIHREAEELRSHYDDDLVHLALMASFVRGWMKDETVAAWLRQHHPKFATVLAKLVQASEDAVVPKRPMKLPFSTTSVPGLPREPKPRRRTSVIGNRQL